MLPRSLQPRPRTVVLLVLLAALAALLSAYSPSLSPPGLHPRGLTMGAAKAKVLLYTSAIGSAPTTISAETKADTYLAAQNAVQYDLYLQSNEATSTIARDLGLRDQRVVASGPFTLLLGLGNLPHPQPPDPRSLNHAYRLLLDVDGATPVLTIYGQAPSAHAAIELVDTARNVLTRHVLNQETAQRQAEGEAAIVRPLGPTVGGLVDPGVQWQLMAFVFDLILAVGGSLLYALRLRGRRAARSADVLDMLDDESFASDDWPHTNRILPWGLAGFMAMLFLVPFQSISLPGGANLDRPLLVALALLWFCALALVSGAARPRVKLTGVHFAALAFFALCCLGVALNAGALANMDEVGLAAKKLALLFSYILFFVIVASVVRPREVPRYVALMVGLGAVLAVATIVEYRTHYNIFYSVWARLLPVTTPSELDTSDSIGRLNVLGPTDQPLELAAMLAMVLPFALMGSIEAATRRRRVLYAVAVGLLLAAGVATSRKTSLVAPAAAILLLAVYRPRTVIRSLLGLALVLGVLVHATSPGALGSVFEQLEPGHVNTVSTTTDRVARYDAVMPDIMSHLLIGRGYGSYDPHKYRILDNEYLGVVIAVGLLGLVGYAAILLAMMLLAHRTIRGPDPRRASLALASLASVGVILVVSALFDVFSFPHVPYLLFFVGGLIVALRNPSPVSPPAPEPARVLHTPLSQSPRGSLGGEPFPPPSDAGEGIGRPRRQPVPVG
jgi:hypothetical protein